MPCDSDGSSAIQCRYAAIMMEKAIQVAMETRHRMGHCWGGLWRLLTDGLILTEPSLQLRMKLQALDCLSSRMNASTLIFYCLKYSKKLWIESRHFLNVTWIRLDTFYCDEDEFLS